MMTSEPNLYTVRLDLGFWMVLYTYMYNGSRDIEFGRDMSKPVFNNC